MTWIRFSGERDFMHLFLACEQEGLLRLGERYLALLQVHSLLCQPCHNFLNHLVDTFAQTAEIQAKLLLVTPSASQNVSFAQSSVILLPHQLPFVEQMQNSLEAFSFDVSLFLFDPNGSLWFAWIGDEYDDLHLADEMLRWLSYLDIQCPE
ncbi:MAG: hypothetical protein DDG59_14540 [Anaerolineae bacterium]|nr:MAG: hypothetical protein DDG59_14540 [Anaerolineae bacterium]